jgi:hypothetical protein
LETCSGGEHPAEEVVERMVAAETSLYNECLIASASTRQYESAKLPARQLGQEVRPSPFSEKQQRQSRYDGGLEDDGITVRRLVPVVPSEPPAHIALEQRNADHGRHALREVYRVPLTGCQLCVAPDYLLPHSFDQDFLLGEEGEVEDSDAAQLAGLPWEFDRASGELKHFSTNLQGHLATEADFERDAKVFEECFARDVRFSHGRNHDHDCSGTCVKNQKKPTLEQLSKLLRANRAPPCRFDFFHIVVLLIAANEGCEKKHTTIRRRGKQIVDEPHIVDTTSRNQFGLAAVERPHPFRSPSTDCGLATLRCNNDFRYLPRSFADARAQDDLFRCDSSQLAACFRALKATILTHAAWR